MTLEHLPPGRPQLTVRIPPSSADSPQMPDLLFLRDLQNRKIPFTYLILCFNFAIFGLMTLAGGTTDPAILLAFGAKSNPAIDSGEIWRFLTPIFIHIGVLHLSFNSYALWIVGPQVERLYGSARFVTLYVLMGIAGVAGSYAFSPDSLSAGASGSIFGLFGVLLVFGKLNQQTVPAFLRRAIGRGMLPVILINLVIGFTIPGIDNAAHLGGLGTGMLLAALLGIKEPGVATPKLARVAQVVSLALVLTGFGQVAANYEGPGRTNRFIDSVNSAQRTFGSSRRAIRGGQNDLGNYTQTLSDTIAAIGMAPSLSPESDLILEKLENVLQDQRSLVEEIQNAGEIRDSHIRQLERNSTMFGDAFGELFEWVDREGSGYGIQLGE